MRQWRRSLALAGAIAGAAPVLPAAADSVEDFYRGRTITIIIGTGENSGAVEAYPKSIARVIRKYIPGEPNIIVSNMPGAGGIKAANYVYGIAPQDGTVWGFITRGFVLTPLLRVPQATFDPTRFNWIGSPARSVSVGETWTANTKVRTIQEAMTQEVVVGATNVTQDTAVFPSMLNRFAGTKFKIVSGYPSSGNIDLAMQKGEVQGKIGVTWTSLNSGSSAGWVKDGVVAVLVQFGLEKDPDVPADIPVALDLARSPEERQAMQVLCAPTALGYPSFLGPQVPKERVDALRAAYAKTMRDPEFLDLAQRQKLDVTPIEGAELERTVKQLYAVPEAAVLRAREVLPSL